MKKYIEYISEKKQVDGIINKPNNDAIESFKISWKNSNDNDIVRSENFNDVFAYINNKNDNFKLTIKFIHEGCDGLEVYDNTFNEFSHIVIFVKEYNAYYISKYTRSGSADDTLEASFVSNELLFNIIPIGEYKLIPYDVKKRYSNYNKRMRNNTSISYNDTIKEKNIDVPNAIVTCLIINTLTNEEIIFKKTIYVKYYLDKERIKNKSIKFCY